MSIVYRFSFGKNPSNFLVAINNSTDFTRIYTEIFLFVFAMSSFVNTHTMYLNTIIFYSKLTAACVCARWLTHETKNNCSITQALVRNRKKEQD